MLDAVRADGTDAVSVCGPVMEKIFAEASEKEQNASEQDDAPRVLVPTDAKKPVSRQRVLRITGIAAAAVCAVGLWIVMPFFRDPGGNTAGQAPSGLEDAQMNPYFTETDALFDEESDTCETEETEETDDSLFSASPEV